MKPLFFSGVIDGTALLMQEAQRASLEGRPSPYSLAAVAKTPDARDLAIAEFRFCSPPPTRH